MSKKERHRSPIYLAPPVMEGWAFTGWLSAESDQDNNDRVIESAFEMSQKSKSLIHHSNILKGDSMESKSPDTSESPHPVKGLIRKLRGFAGI